jgi:adenylate cyclase
MRVCQSCGMENRVGARFCDACGATLGAAAEQASPVRKTVTILFADVSGSTGRRFMSDSPTG